MELNSSRGRDAIVYTFFSDPSPFFFRASRNKQITILGWSGEKHFFRRNVLSRLLVVATLLGPPGFLLLSGREISPELGIEFALEVFEVMKPSFPDAMVGVVFVLRRLLLYLSQVFQVVFNSLRFPWREGGKIVFDFSWSGSGGKGAIVAFPHFVFSLVLESPRSKSSETEIVYSLSEEVSPP